MPLFNHCLRFWMSVYCTLKERAICFTGSLSDHIMGGFETSDTEKLLMLDAEAALEMLIFFVGWGWGGGGHSTPQKKGLFGTKELRKTQERIGMQ